MGEIAALSAAFVWACASLIFVRIGRAGISPFVLNTFKGVIALGLMGFTIAILFGHLIPPQLTVNDALILSLSGLFGITIGDTCYFYALEKLGPRRTLLFATLCPPMTAILGFVFLGEPFTRNMVVGIILTLIGVYWVISQKQDEPENHNADDFNQKLASHFKVGILFALAAMMSQSVGNVLTKFSSTEISALGISIIRLGGSLIGLILIMTWKGWWKKTNDVIRTPRIFIAIIVATFFGTFLGIWLLNAGLKYTTHTGIAATLSSTSPIFILPLAYFFEREKISLRAVLGSVLAIAGIAVLFL